MKKRQDPFTDPNQLGELNQEVWAALEGGPKVPKKMKSESNDTAPPSPGAVVGDEEEKAPPMA